MVIAITNCAQLKLTIFKVDNQFRDVVALADRTKTGLNQFFIILK
jgi:hypothetical protein